MKDRLMSVSSTLLILTLGLFLSASLAWGQGAKSYPGKVVVPDSSIERSQDIGIRAHTNHVIYQRSTNAVYSTPWGLPPDTLRQIYQLSLTANVSPGNSGGSGVIAIVDAYDYPTAQTDFDKFSTQFGLPLSTQSICNGSKPCFTKVYATGSKPRGNCGWNQEAALDIEWAHAMAPYAQIILVEAKTASFSDLFTAVNVASNEVACGSASCSGGTGEGEVSMSWGGSEFSSETSYDSYLSRAGIIYFASSGDTGGQIIYPSSSPNAVAAGGTSLVFNGSQTPANFVGETGWSGSGGGVSAYEPIPAYQNGIVLVGTHRGTPDMSFDADPNTGVDVYDSTSCQGVSGWLVFGGTSVAAPSLAGVVNAAGHGYTSSVNELNYVYSIYNTPSSYASDYRDVTSGTAGSFTAGPGWDLVTGIGSPLTYNGK